jgi:hypothetical protein
LHGYTEATKAEAQEMKRVVEEDRKALEQEKAAMEKAHDFQTSKILLVGLYKLNAVDPLTSCVFLLFYKNFLHQMQHGNRVNSSTRRKQRLVPQA